MGLREEATELGGGPRSFGGWKRGRLRTQAKCLHLGQKTSGSRFIVVDTSALRDKGVGTSAKNLGGKECSREELSVYLRGACGLDGDDRFGGRRGLRIGGEWSGGSAMPGEGSQEAAFRGKGMTHLGEEGRNCSVCLGWEWAEREWGQAQWVRAGKGRDIWTQGCLGT